MERAAGFPSLSKLVVDDSSFGDGFVKHDLCEAVDELLRDCRTFTECRHDSYGRELASRHTGHEYVRCGLRDSHFCRGENPTCPRDLVDVPTGNGRKTPFRRDTLVSLCALSCSNCFPRHCVSTDSCIVVYAALYVLSTLDVPKPEWRLPRYCLHGGQRIGLLRASRDLCRGRPLSPVVWMCGAAWRDSGLGRDMCTCDMMVTSWSG